MPGAVGGRGRAGHRSALPRRRRRHDGHRHRRHQLRRALGGRAGRAAAGALPEAHGGADRRPHPGDGPAARGWPVRGPAGPRRDRSGGRAHGRARRPDARAPRARRPRCPAPPRVRRLRLPASRSSPRRARSSFCAPSRPGCCAALPTSVDRRQPHTSRPSIAPSSRRARPASDRSSPAARHQVAGRRRPRRRHLKAPRRPA